MRGGTASSQGGRITSAVAPTTTIAAYSGNSPAAAPGVFPPQKAGRIAEIAGVADNTGWCPIDPVSFASKLAPNIYVIGDACFAGGIPKSASAANAQAKACAAAIMNALAGKASETPRLNGACYNTVAPGYAVSLKGTYQPKDGQFPESEVVTSAVEAPREVRQREAEQALDWFKTITVD